MGAAARRRPQGIRAQLSFTASEQAQRKYTRLCTGTGAMCREHAPVDFADRREGAMRYRDGTGTGRIGIGLGVAGLNDGMDFGWMD